MADVVAVLVELNRGFGLQEISAELESVIDAVRVAGGTGEVTIKLKVEGVAWDPDTNRLTEIGVTHMVSTKLPKRRVRATAFFVSDEGNLSRNHPRQEELFSGADGARREV